MAIVFVFRKMYPILTEGQIILSYPLTVILSSLRSDLHHPCGATKVYLIPLETVIMARAPGCAVAPPMEKQSAVIRTVISGPTGGSAQLWGADTAIAHSQGFVAAGTLTRERTKR